MFVSIEYQQSEQLEGLFFGNTIRSGGVDLADDGISVLAIEFELGEEFLSRKSSAMVSISQVEQVVDYLLSSEVPFSGELEGLANSIAEGSLGHFEFVFAEGSIGSGGDD